MKRLVTRHLAFLCLLLVPLLVFHHALFLGEAFVPADQLGHLFPYKTLLEKPEPWNVLRFDGITQFYPWRLEVARQWSEGKLPVWNTYQFAASGGTPLLANSQSAPFYPLNLVFLLCYKAGVFWYAFGLSAAIHLFIAAKGVYHLLRSLAVRRSAALLGAFVFGLSGPVITWLALPTFLAVSCWLPWLLLFIRRAHQKAGTRSGFKAGVLAGAVGGLLLLAGHLQVAFYCLLAAGLYLLWEGHFTVRLQKRTGIGNWLATIAVAGTVLIGLALPQLLPVLELSRVSHRAAVGPPTIEGYQAFVASALPIRNLVTFMVPDFFGHPNQNDGFYWNSNNYTEWCGYVGIVPLLLAAFALGLPWKNSRLPIERAFFAGLFLLTLLMAMGTPVNLPFFFLVPGFGQLGNPGRILVVTALCLSVLAAFGLQGLLDDEIPLAQKTRAGLIALAAPLLLAAIGASQSVPFAQATLPNLPFGQLMSSALPGIMEAGLFLILGILLLVAGARRTQCTVVAAGALLLTVTDLVLWGYNYNPSRPAKDVYPITPGITYLQQNGQNDLIAPINRQWSLYAQRPPANAVLPPNGLTVYRLHDVGGYDSLFRSVSKDQVRSAAGGADPSPPENGNLIFVKSVETALALRARYIVVPPDTPDLSAVGITPVYTGADMVIYRNPDGVRYDASSVSAGFPRSLVLGLAASALGFTILLGSQLVSFPRKLQG